MKLDYTAWQFWLTAVVAVINICVLIYTWASNRDKARTKDLKEIKDDIRDVDKRVTRLEENQIGHEELGKVYERINAVSDQVSEMKGEMKGSLGSIGGSVDMILDHLLKDERGKL